jgi:hypothetical protein
MIFCRKKMDLNEKTWRDHIHLAPADFDGHRAQLAEWYEHCGIEVSCEKNDSKKTSNYSLNNSWSNSLSGSAYGKSGDWTFTKDREKISQSSHNFSIFSPLQAKYPLSSKVFSTKEADNYCKLDQAG